MLSLEDCIALCELSEDEVLAIAEHERVPPLAAAAIGHYLVKCADGELCVKHIIRDDIEAAVARGDLQHALALKLALREFVLHHPRCDERLRSGLRVPERREGSDG